MILRCLAVARIWRVISVALVFGLTAQYVPPVFGQQSGESKLAAILQPLIDAHEGTVALGVRNLKTGEEFFFNADSPMPTASLVKFPLMVAAYQRMADNELDPKTLLTVQKEDKVPGSGILTEHFSDGTQLSLLDVIHLMIVYSDNTATNLVANQVGLEYLARYMERSGFAETKMHSLVYRRDTSIFPDRSDKFGLGSTTVSETMRLFEMVWNRQVVDQLACKDMLDHLFANDDDLMLKRYLPAGTRFAHKTGAVTAVRNDAGIIDSPAGPIAICVLTAENADTSYSKDNKAELFCGDVGRAVFLYFNPVDAGSGNATEPLRVGSAGEMVLALQRSLNDRLDPSPALSVDGEFGPMTLEALNAFQKSKSIPVTEQMNVETWAALGNLITTDAPIPSPEIVNSEVPVLKPKESLTGPPIVNARAWAIGDGKTGEMIWHENGDIPMNPASVTKMMTAWVVVGLAERSPEVLDEIITFSGRAASTEGSTSGLRAGESVSVGELLYGMMLPSGNDASVAMAEHFGARLAADMDISETDPFLIFVEAMNREAKRLGLETSTFRNTAGFTDEKHLASAADWVKLGALAMQKPLFRKVVGTAKHGARVTGPGGYTRNVVWESTNQLLDMEGYHGLKTGTTDAAGACLAAHASRGERELIVVVLGCDSSQSRYVDARNLFRWAWTQLGEADTGPMEKE